MAFTRVSCVILADLLRVATLVCSLPVAWQTPPRLEDSVSRSPTRGSEGVAMDHADRCRTQAEECHRLMLLSQSGAEATILTSLMRSWKMIANQTDRYVAIIRREAAQRR
jgi:hypothetical protein